MAYRVAWSPRALDDIDSIASYIARDSVAYASAVVAKIIKSTRTLRRFPFSGRVVPEFDDENLRERFVHSYRIIYRIEHRTVTIAAVIHGKRMLEDALKEA
ncbi:MAG TPA: type II toxin-antitoxin system mRNA interferase toxin, RelE/StbE family [Blastocatellia bacterium]|nr:type II toxin-antitoxin system mRNA interferase toxin, RelE/StbE family [Blastocatellia bacterium]